MFSSKSQFGVLEGQWRNYTTRPKSSIVNQFEYLDISHLLNRVENTVTFYFPFTPSQTIFGLLETISALSFLKSFQTYSLILLLLSAVL